MLLPTAATFFNSQNNAAEEKEGHLLPVLPLDANQANPTFVIIDWCSHARRLCDDEEPFLQELQGDFEGKQAVRLIGLCV